MSQECTVVLPLHPRTRNQLQKEGWLHGITVIDPVPYFEMQRIEMVAKVILTDSGGVQKEAFFHGVPCLTIRNETEWIETVEIGCNRLVGVSQEDIVEAFHQAHKPEMSKEMPYGNGDAAGKILESMMAVSNMA